ncbi:MoaD/ThiS family protein [Candidatus Micrarchaeota archaeon]|nr:MoaD/ThiS family protein [Candidatus Micrarchaeota archaeon]MBU1165332.1 MoaD/ThiS family protein [Candidatus Micrarchaeota archaeon]MBU1886982.1 MoaD/ThiS family protein [Candidatus Micrarchaeota archaeon]
MTEIIVDNEKKKMKFRGTLGDLLYKLKVRREEVVIKLNGKIAPETREIKANDKVEIIKVVFGG